MNLPYIVGMGVAYTAALWLLVRRCALPWAAVPKLFGGCCRHCWARDCSWPLA